MLKTTLLLIAGTIGLNSAIVAARPHAQSDGKLANGFTSLIAGKKPFSGSQDANIRIVGFIDYECRSCRENFDHVARVAAETPGTQMPPPQSQALDTGGGEQAKKRAAQ